ncbi:MAG: hypothetical protein CMB31_01505 [Euryarchaeota archaeon]|nr:hypothetical protein [Euryarchaeota archaeon]
MSSEEETQANEDAVFNLPGAVDNGAGCPSIPEQETYNPADSLDKLEEAAKAMGMDEQCVSEAKAIQSDEMSSTKASAQVSTPFGGGSASYEQNDTSSYVDNTLTKKGCSPLSLVSNQLKLEEVAMTCTMNSTVSKQDAQAISNVSLTIETNPIIDPTVIASIDAGRKEIQDLMDASQEAVNALVGDDSLNKSIERLTVTARDTEMFKLAKETLEKMFQDKKDLVERTHKMNVKALEHYNYNTPVTANLEGVNINQRIDSEMSISSTQNIDDTSKSIMKESMKRLSRAVAHETLASEVGPGETLDEARSMVNDQIDESFVKNDTNINNSISENKMSVDNNNNIVLSVVGPIRNSDISQAISSQVSLTVQQQVKKSVEIGKTVATKIINETVTKTLDERVKKGVDAVVEASGDSRAKLQEAMKAEDLADVMKAQGEGAASMWEGAGTGVGGAAEGLGTGIGTAGKGLGEGAASALSALMIPIAVIGGIIVLVILYMMFGGKSAPAAAPAAAGGNLAGLMAAAKSAGGANFAKLAAAAKGVAAKGGVSKFGLPFMLLARFPWRMTFGLIMFVLFILFMIFYGYPKLKKKFEGRVRDNKVNIPAPRQAMPPVNTQSLKTPYKRVETRNFKGDRSARKIPSYKKINQSRNFRRPTQKQHVNMYNAVDPGLDITTVHNPSYHFQNKVDDKPVMYTKISRV